MIIGITKNDTIPIIVENEIVINFNFEFGFPRASSGNVILYTIPGTTIKIPKNCNPS